MTGATSSPPPHDVLAAELVFGLLDPDERAEALARRARDADFAAACAWWDEQLAGLFATAADQPDAAVWRAIARALPANDEAEAVTTLRRSLRRWRAGSAVLAAIALATGVGLLTRRPTVVVAAQAPARPPVLAILTGSDRPGVVTISYDPGQGRIASAVQRFDPGVYSAELWVIPAGGKPVSLGLVPTTYRYRALAPDAGRLIAHGATLAISLEPRGGSPTGAPTGKVVLTAPVA